MAHRWRRKLIRVSVGAVALGILALAALPWWWPAVIARVAGFTVGDWATSGWSSVELRNLSFRREGLHVTAASVRVPAFGRWPKPEEGPMVVATAVVVTPEPISRPDPPPAPSARRVFADVLRAWPAVQKWLPSAHVDSLRIVPAADGGARLQFTDIRWDGAQLSATTTFPLLGSERPATFTVGRPDAQSLEISAAAASLDIAVTTRAQLAGEQLEIAADLRWREITARAEATFGANGLTPARATLQAPDVTVPAADLGLAGYGPIRGSIHGEWTGQTYAATVIAQASPVDPAAQLPPVSVDVRASGDLASVRVESALVRIPGVNASLSSPLILALPGGMPASPASFALEIELADVPRSPVRGRVTGAADVAGGPGVAPTVQFSLTGEGIHWREGEISALTVAGRWTPEVLELEPAEVRLGDGSRLEAGARLDLRQQRLEYAKLSGRLTAAALRPWVPGVPEFEELVVDAQAEGPWAAPTHHGTARWRGLVGLPGGTLGGDVTWRGEGVNTSLAEGTLLVAQDLTLPFAVGFTREPDGAARLDVTQLAWHDAAGEWLHLAGPAAVRFSPAGLVLENVRLAGDAVSLSADASVQWPAVGHIAVQIEKMAAARLAAFLPPAAHAAHLDRFSLTAAWDHGPVQLDGSLRASYEADQASGYFVEAEFRTETDELAFGTVRVSDASGVVLQGEGRVPLQFAGREDGFRFDLPRDGALSLRLDSVPNEAFWESVSRLTKWEIVGPELHVALAGTLAAPEGRIAFDAASLQPPEGLVHTVKLPRLGEVSVIATADAGGLAITRAIWTIDEHWVSLLARVPWSIWREARASGRVPWRDAEFSFAADRMPLLIASRALPRLLAPDGTVSFEMKHEPGSGFTGFLWLDTVALRPIPPLGALRDIGGTMLLHGYALTLERLAAFLGGRPITIAGEANVENLEHPVFEVHLNSSRVPLVRQEGLVLRAALDLHVTQTAEKPAHISGKVDLARSVFVSDLIALLPTGGGVAAPEQRPPFFSVPQEPFSTWTLDVDLRGEDFLQIQNPFFRSEVSADFKLTGTLQEPRAVGRAWTNQGSIIFPFGNLAVQQAELLLTPEQPYELTLLGSAATRIYGYNVRLEISGTVRDPRLLFSSEPPLSSQQLFLMLSAGELPREEDAFSTSARAQRLALFVGRNLATTFGMGGGSGSDRLVVRSGEDFSREGGETIYVQYNLDGRWSLVAEKDRFDAYNAGIKFRLIDR